MEGSKTEKEKERGVKSKEGGAESVRESEEGGKQREGGEGE